MSVHLRLVQVDNNFRIHGREHLYAYEVHRHELVFVASGRVLRVRTDLTTTRNSRELTKQLPASYGSCLQLTVNGVVFQTYGNMQWKNAYTLPEICRALRGNRDIERLPELKEWANHHARDALAQYHATKKERLQEIGYKIVRGTGISLAEYTEADRNDTERA